MTAMGQTWRGIKQVEGNQNHLSFRRCVKRNEMYFFYFLSWIFFLTWQHITHGEHRTTNSICPNILRCQRGTPIGIVLT